MITIIIPKHWNYTITAQTHIYPSLRACLSIHPSTCCHSHIKLCMYHFHAHMNIYVHTAYVRARMHACVYVTCRHIQTYRPRDKHRYQHTQHPYNIKREHIPDIPYVYHSVPHPAVPYHTIPEHRRDGVRMCERRAHGASGRTPPSERARGRCVYISLSLSLSFSLSLSLFLSISLSLSLSIYIYTHSHISYDINITNKYYIEIDIIFAPSTAAAKAAGSTHSYK